MLHPQVLLIDAGCEWNCYAADSKQCHALFLTRRLTQHCLVTRTMPVGNEGKFTPEARDIYNLVLEMQKVSKAEQRLLNRP